MLPILRNAFVRHGSTVVTRAARPMFRTQRPYATAAQQGTSFKGDVPWIIGSLFFTIPAVAYLLSGDTTTHHSGAHTGQHVHHPSSLDESTKQQPSDAGSEGTEAELVIVLEESPAVDNGEDKSENPHSSTQPPPEAATGQEKSSNGGNTQDEPSEKAKQTGIKDTEEVKEVKENVKDSALLGNPEGPETDNHRDATTEENKKPYTDLTHVDQGVGAVSREPGSMNTHSGKQEPELFDGRGKR